MPVYISMLRGINVGGHKLVSMTRLKALYDSLGFTGATTYIQSGNVIFGARTRSLESLRASIEHAVERTFGFPVTVIVRSSGDMGRVIKECAFTGGNAIDERWLYVVFLSAQPAPALARALLPLAAKTDDSYHLAGTHIYLYCPGGFGKTLLSNAFFEKHLKVAATARNWRTVNALFSMSRERE